MYTVPRKQKEAVLAEVLRCDKIQGRPVLLAERDTTVAETTASTATLSSVDCTTLNERTVSQKAYDERTSSKHDTPDTCGKFLPC
jgi:hypothetical protein